MKYTHKVCYSSGKNQEWWFARLDGNILTCSNAHRADGSEYETDSPYTLEGNPASVKEFYEGYPNYVVTPVNSFRGNVD